jgi:hypothetical protein
MSGYSADDLHARGLEQSPVPLLTKPFRQDELVGTVNRILGNIVGTREGLRVIATLMGGGFLVYAVLAVVRGTLHDVDDGRVDRSARPVTFWLLVGGMTLLGLSILGVGWEWPLVNAVGQLSGPH